MDVDLWSSRVHSAKHLSGFHVASRINSDNHLFTDDLEGDDDACFPCPFCYVDIEVRGLCNHSQEEHCFDLKNAVCPLCAANLGKDVIGHFIAQHASSLKRKRKSQKSGGSAMLSKELSSFLGSSTNGRGNAHESLSDPKGIRQDECSNSSASVTADLKSSEVSLLDEGHEQDNKERRKRAGFVQELFVSTIF